MKFLCLYCGTEFNTYTIPKCPVCKETRLFKAINKKHSMNQYDNKHEDNTKDIKDLVETYKKNDLIITDEDAKVLLEKFYSIIN